jgi:hypothetical protein
MIDHCLGEKTERSGWISESGSRTLMGAQIRVATTPSLSYLLPSLMNKSNSFIPRRSFPLCVLQYRKFEKQISLSSSSLSSPRSAAANARLLNVSASRTASHVAQPPKLFSHTTLGITIDSTVTQNLRHICKQSLAWPKHSDSLEARLMVYL